MLYIAGGYLYDSSYSSRCQIKIKSGGLSVFLADVLLEERRTIGGDIALCFCWKQSLFRKWDFLMGYDYVASFYLQSAFHVNYHASLPVRLKSRGSAGVGKVLCGAAMRVLEEIIFESIKSSFHCSIQVLGELGLMIGIELVYSF